VSDGARVTLIVDGNAMSASKGTTVAAALINSGFAMFRSSVSGEARGPVCGMGVCYECRVTIDGVRHQRSCTRTVVEGMRVDTAKADVG